jgi:hypothetical protein
VTEYDTSAVRGVVRRAFWLVSFADLVEKHDPRFVQDRGWLYPLLEGFVVERCYGAPQLRLYPVRPREACVPQTDGDLATDSRGATIHDRLRIGLTVRERWGCRREAQTEG